MKLFIAYIFLAVAISLYGCNEFLEAKPDKKLVVPTQVKELQGLLDYYNRVNEFGNFAGEFSSDNFYVESDVLRSSADFDRRLYLWEKDYFFREGAHSWSYEYENVYRANTVLDHLDQVELTPDNRGEWESLKGQAHFLRARVFLETVNVWSLAYDPTSSSRDMGIPLRLNSDFNVPSVRSTVEQSYQQVVDDLKQAISLLPERQMTVMRSNRFTAYGYLARTYLAMRNYGEAEKYADSCLLATDFSLMDYNQIAGSKAYPFERFNSEVMYELRMMTPGELIHPKGKIKAELVDAFHENDLRKDLFFVENPDGSHSFRGSYEGTSGLFAGFSLPEAYLMKAEAAIRNGRVSEGIAALNQLLESRWKTGSFTPYPVLSQEEALDVVLLERRKELLHRGLRWMDIKRLNKEGRNIILQREFDGKTYTLEPNSPRYALPIPEDVISQSGMPQNPR